MSVLVYNFDAEARKQLLEANKTAQAAELIREYDKEQEFLLRCSGLSGKFRIARYRLTRENCVRIYRRLLEHADTAHIREEVLQKWMSLPSVEFEEFTSADTLNLRTKMNGFSAELILIDKI